MEYSLLDIHGSVTSPILSTAMSGLTTPVYPAASYACKSSRAACPLFVTAEGIIVGATGGDGTSSVTIRCCGMGTAAAMTAATDANRLWSRGAKFFAESDAAIVIQVGAAPADQPIYASFGVGTFPNPIVAPFVSLRISNAGTAYTGGTLTIHTISIWC